MKYKINYSIGGALQPIVTPIQTLQPIVTPMQRVARIPISEVEPHLINPLAETMSNKQIIQTCSVNKIFCQKMNWKKLIKDRNINIETVLNLDDIIPTICNNTSDYQLPFCRKFYNYTKYYKYTKHFNTIAAGGRHSMALKNDGTVIVWGSDNYDQRDGKPAGLNNVVSIAAGGSHSMALKNDGTVSVWGRNTHDQRDGKPAGLNNVVSIAAGGSHSMALKNDGTVVVWGDNEYGQRDNIPAGLNNVVSIAAGDYHSMALQNDGTVVVWGRNDED
jgi:alpha-tubulin suppressor-like RCC1 family protein